jgi:hypothetical protein
MRKIILMTFCFFFLSQFTYGQKGEEKIKTDTLRIYHSIERFAKKKRLTYQLYKAVFNLPDSTKKKTSTVDAQPKPDYYERYGGKIVRDIIIQTLDPFGYRVRDTSVHPRSIIQKGGNFLHNCSSNFTVKNQLLIKKGEPLDPLKLKESERLVRQAQYVRDVMVTVKPVKGTDSVDVYFREQDLWSIGMGVGISASKETVLFRDKNFAGLSHELEAYWYYYNDTKKNLVVGSYTVPYLRNTYITAKGYFSSDPGTYVNGISVNRGFYSALTKWAWGVDYLFHGFIDSTGVADAPRIAYPLHYNDLDLWAGRSYPLSLSKSFEARSTKLITSARFLNRTYTMRLPADIDTSFLYFNSRFYIGGVGITNRLYYRDYYIYRYGTPEDVPAGRIAEVLIGYQEGMNTGRMYAGGILGFGNHYNHLGYLSMTAGYGTFLRNSKPEQSVFNTTLGYFSDLLQVSEWRLRQFAKVQCVYGFNRKSGEEININDDNGIKGLESDMLTGTNKLVVSLQSLVYLPYRFIGFRFAPFIFLNFAMLGTESAPFIRNRLYQGYGIGLLIKNELLTINSFQISIGIYPFIRDADNSLFKYNPIKTYNFTFRDFDIQKPAEILYE